MSYDPNDPFDNRVSDVAYEVRSKYGAKNSVRGPYRHKANAEKAFNDLMSEGIGTWAWELARIDNCPIRCWDEPAETSESEWCK